MGLLIIDTREKPRAIKRIVEYFEHKGIKYTSSKMLFGDYMDYNKPDVVIDRKQNIAELAKNCTVEHERFKRELERAREAGATLIILVEQNDYYTNGERVRVNTIEDLLRWRGKHTIIRGEKIYRVLSAWMRQYPLQVEFCPKNSTGYKIVNLIYGENNER